MNTVNLFVQHEGYYLPSLEFIDYNHNYLKLPGNNTMKQALLLLTLCTLSLSSQAEKGQSIMFGDQDPVYTEPVKTDPAREKADYCNDLRKQMDELKGRPQKRNMVIQRYDLECQQR